MKKIGLLLTFACFLGACSSKSKKGAWDAEEKQNYTNTCVSKYEKDDAMKADKTNVPSLCSCITEKAQANFETPGSLSKSDEEKILSECFVIR